MNRLLFTLVLFSVVIVCGCDGNNYGWYKPGVSEGQISWDSSECLKKAEYRDNVGGFDSIHANDSYRMSDDEFPTRRRGAYSITRCMKAKGYRWVLKDF